MFLTKKLGFIDVLSTVALSYWHSFGTLIQWHSFGTHTFDKVLAPVSLTKFWHPYKVNTVLAPAPMTQFWHLHLRHSFGTRTHDTVLGLAPLTQFWHPHLWPGKTITQCHLKNVELNSTWELFRTCCKCNARHYYTHKMLTETFSIKITHCKE